jgi:hypothetical protein
MPETEEVCSPGRKFRPVFVVATDDRNGRTEVLCVYGTSQHIDRIGRGEFVVSCSDLPLEKPTKFSFRKMFWLPLDKTYELLAKGALRGGFFAAGGKGGGGGRPFLA